MLLLSLALAQEGPLPPQLSDGPSLWEHPNPSHKRAMLRRVGGVSLAAGAIWFLAVGDTLGSGDPSSLLGGFGLVAVGGTLMGGVAASTRPDMQPMTLRAAGPWLSANLGVGGTSIIDEVVPYTGGLRTSPRLTLGEHAQLVVNSRWSGNAAWSAHVDPRPQGTYDVVLQERTRAMDLEPEVRWTFTHGDVRVRQMWWVRWDTLEYADGTERTVRREAMTPAVGARWYISERQRFQVHLGPRWNRLSWTEDGTYTPRSTQLGPVYGDATYAIHLAHPDRWGFERVSRLRFTYVHSNFDGLGFDLGAIVGFFGPVILEWELRMKAPESSQSWQLGVALGMNSPSPAVALTLGWTPEMDR